MTMSETVLPFSFIAVSVGPFMNSVAVSLVLNPLPDVTVSCGALPHAVSVLDAVDPLTVISVSALPGVQSLAADSSVLVITQILIPVTKSLIAFAVPFVLLPGSFIYSRVVVEAYS